MITTMSVPLAPELYYLSNFRTALAWVAERYAVAGELLERDPAALLAVILAAVAVGTAVAAGAAAVGAAGLAFRAASSTSVAAPMAIPRSPSATWCS
mgnify:CR=1 FL=1